jgi:cell division protein FtsB
METLTREEMYQREIAEMQAQVHRLQLRVKELHDENELLKKQLFGEATDGC